MEKEGKKIFFNSLLSAVVFLSVALVFSAFFNFISLEKNVSLGPQPEEATIFLYKNGELFRNETVTINGTGTIEFSDFTLPADVYEWNVRVKDAEGKIFSSSQDFTLFSQERPIDPTEPDPPDKDPPGGSRDPPDPDPGQTPDSIPDPDPTTTPSDQGSEPLPTQGNDSLEKPSKAWTFAIFGFLILIILIIIIIILLIMKYSRQNTLALSVIAIAFFAIMAFSVSNLYTQQLSVSFSPLDEFRVTLLSPANGSSVYEDDLIDFTSNYSESSIAWIKMNGGLPVDGEYGLEDISQDPLPGDSVFIDNGGNVLFFYRGAELQTLGGNRNARDVRIGRFNTDKQWEIFTNDGWSSSPDAVPYSLAAPKSTVFQVSLIQNPGQEELFGVASLGITRSSSFLDAHTSGVNFIFDNEEFSFWTKPGYESHHAQPLLWSWSSMQGFAYDLVVGEDEIILLGGSQSNVGRPEQLVMARYKEGKWENWNDTQWIDPYDNPFTAGEGYSYLPFILNDLINHPAPRINYLGDNKYLITYLDDSGPNSLRTVLMDYSTMEFEVWDGDGWNPNYPSAIDIYSEFSFWDIVGRKSFSDGNNVHEIFFEGEPGQYYLSSAHYNHLKQEWNVNGRFLSPTIKSSFPSIRFAAALDSEGELWLVTENGNSMELYLYNGQTWDYKGVIHQSSSIIPHSLIFTDNDVPILLASEEYLGARRLFAFSIEGEFWEGEKTKGIKEIPESPRELEPSIGSPVSQWDLDIFATVSDSKGVYEYELSPTSCPFLDIDSEGKVYCVDPEWSNPGVGIYPGDYSSPTTRAEETAFYWGDNRPGGYFNWMGGIAVDNVRDRVYIAHRLHRQSAIMPDGRLQIWDKNLNDRSVAKVLNIGGEKIVIDSPYSPTKINTLQGQPFKWPSDIAVDEANGFVYVSESGGNRIAKFTSTTSSISFSEFIGEGFLNFPIGMDTDRDGNLYVADSANHRIVKYNPQGEIIATFGSPGKGEDEFLYPHSLAVDKVTGYVYIADIYNKKVIIFNSDGEFTYSFGSWNPDGGISSFEYLGGIAVRNNKVYVGVRFLNPGIERTIISFEMNSTAFPPLQSI